jgi:hypothetical protein
LLNERFERRPIEPQTERGDAAFEKFLIAQRCPIGRYYMEYISLPKLLDDAKARNRAFFRRLGLED